MPTLIAYQRPLPPGAQQLDDAGMRILSAPKPRNAKEEHPRSVHSS